MNRTRLHPGMCACALLITLACGGGGGGGGTSTSPTTPPASPWASALVYANPPSGNGFRFVANQALSTPTRLVLDLVGPAAQSGQGLSFILKTDASKVTWVAPSTTSGLVQNVAFNLLPGPQALVGLDKGGGSLHGAVYQNSGSIPLGQPLVRVCLSLNAGAVGAGVPVPLTLSAGNSLSNGGVIAPIDLAFGSLTAK
ncbi:hypothetical protein GETHOR_24030 [Geothrix oryzae]|uniref:DUF4382 domain-containing protein n=1 Tax=Geothrix oryzae TaxID=2927975 RepID=A0ABM8DTA7_9BACT|nr:hypothetical protein GETHOR_24030 [Geothrix oryzae]